MHEQPHIFSVIIPVHNRERVILNAVESVLSQTFTDFELIVVDDASSDNTIEKLKSVKDVRLKIIHSEVNRGAAHARNVGIVKSSGKYISFLDSDDSFDSNFLEESFKTLEAANESVGFVWCGARFHERKADGTTTVIERIWKPSVTTSPYHTFLHNLQIGIGCGVSFRREVFDKAGLFNEALPAAEDTEFFLRAAKYFGFGVIEKLLINIYKTGGDRMSTRFNNLSKAYQLFIPSHLSEIEKEKALRLKYYYKLCWLSYYDNKKGAARKYFARILKDDPLHSKAWTIGILFEIFGKNKAAKIHQRFSKVS